MDCDMHFTVRFKSVVHLMIILACLTTMIQAQNMKQGLQTVEDFKRLYGDGWIIRMDYGAGIPYLIWGKAIDLGMIPVTDGEYETISRLFIDNHQALFGFNSNCLALGGMHRISLSRIGASDKVSVHFL